MSKSLIILGRQPALGLAELESLFGADKVTPFGDQAALLDVEAADVYFPRLGGAIKLCSTIATGYTTDFSRVQKLLTPQLPAFASLPETGKITLGLSAYGLKISKEKLFAAGLTLKKQLRNADRSVRLVPLTEGTHLNSAQVLHNKLLTDSGRELVFVSDGRQTVCAETVDEQNLESYTLRDRGRPKRDARVGMLPPKLAQTIINLAAGDVNSSRSNTILDPFCGTGVLLQEAMLMGYDAYGTDLEPRMIEYTQKNLEWLRQEYNPPGQYNLAVGDATGFHWNSPIGHVASEAYLGRPFTTKPNPEILTKTVSDVNLILKKFLHNIGSQLESGTRLCLGVPAWNLEPSRESLHSSAVRDDRRASERSVRKKYVSTEAESSARNVPNAKIRFKHLPLIDQLGDLGYNRVSFEHVRDEDLLYYREDQIVARELLVITRK